MSSFEEDFPSLKERRCVRMDNEQRQAQLEHERMTGIHNTQPCECCLCGKFIKVGMRELCPHKNTEQKTVVYPKGSDGFF